MPPPLNALIRTLVIVAVLTAAPLTVLADSIYFIPHLAVGRMGADRFTTQVIITSGFASDVTIRFVQPGGTNWSVPVSSNERPDLNGTYASQTFSMGTDETVTLNLIAGEADLTTGWLRIWAQEPLTVSAVFTMYNWTANPTFPLLGVTTIRGDVGVPPAIPDTGFRLNFSLGTANPWIGVTTDYGLALANPSGRVAEVNLSIYDEEGTQQGTTKTLVLAAGEQTAQFLGGLFPEVNFGLRFSGRLEIRSDAPIAPLALKVSNGGLASVPLNRRANKWVNRNHGLKPQGMAALIPPALNDLPAFVTGQVDLDADPDVDRYRVNLEIGETIVITPIYSAIGSMGQLTVQLRNPSGTIVRQGSTSAAGRDPSRLVFTAVAAGWHIIEVTGTPPMWPFLFKGLTTYHLHVTSED